MRFNSLQNLNLFEYQNSEIPNLNVLHLEKLLNNIWGNRYIGNIYYRNIQKLKNNEPGGQKYLNIYADGKVKSCNYVGIIRSGNTIINLLPKIFYSKDIQYNDDEVKAIHAHILWWLSYCKKFKFPGIKGSFNKISSDIFETLIYFYAKYTLDLFSTNILQGFEEISGEVPYMKGRLDCSSYITRNISRARWQNLNCVFDSFEYDNYFNRIVKYVSRLLFNSTTNNENKNLLRKILFILEDVKDITATADDCSRVKINSLFSEMFVVLDYCRLFLSNSVTHNFSPDFKIFAFLLPMEYLFEDFIYGFIEHHFPKLKAKAQASDLFLATLNGKEVFNIKHDILLNLDNQPVVIDTKYKIINTQSNFEDVNYSISQSDLYQAVAYAIRRNAKRVFLFYPKNLLEINSPGQDLTFKILDCFSDTTIEVKIIKLPVIKSDWKQIKHREKLNKNFTGAEDDLKIKLEDVFSNHN